MVYVFNPYSLNLKSISSHFISPRSCVPNTSSKCFDDIAGLDFHMSPGLLSKPKPKKSKAKRFSSFFSFELVRIQALQITFCCKNVHTAYKFNIYNSVLSTSPLTHVLKFRLKMCNCHYYFFWCLYLLRHIFHSGK